MIVAGEASESDECDEAAVVAASTAAILGDGAEVAVELDDDEPSPPPPSTATSSDASSWRVFDAASAVRSSSLATSVSATVGAVTEAVGRQWNKGGGYAQSSFDAAATASASDPPRSLLHQKLLEKNASLLRAVEGFANQNLGGACRQVENLLASCQKTQAHLQETVLSNQQSTHFCAEAVESADNLLRTAARIEFPK